MIEFNNENQENNPNQGNLRFNPTERLLRQKPKRNLVKTAVPGIIMLTAMAGLAYLGWNAYQENVNGPADPSKIPVMRADSQPFKQEPDAEQTENIPNADKKVYEAIAHTKSATDDAADAARIKVITPAEEPVDRNNLNQKENNAEQILAKPEENKPVEEKANVESTNQELKNTTETATQNVEEKIIAAPQLQEKIIEKPADSAIEKSAASPAPAPETVHSEVAPVEKNIEKPAANLKKTENKTEEKSHEVKLVEKNQEAKIPEKKKAKEESKPKLTSKSIRVQLGAFKTQSEAKDAWEKIKKRHAKTFEGLNYMIEKKDVPGKGIFYRLQAGPLKTDAAAKLLCKKLTEAKQGCFIAN